MKRLTICLLTCLIFASCEEETKKTTTVTVTTYAGGTEGDVDGPGTSSRLSAPGHIAIGPDGTLYFTDTNNHKVKKVTPDGQVVTVAGTAKGFADGPADEAKFNRPLGIAIAADGSIYVTDSTRIRRITPDLMVTTLAGSAIPGNQDGTGTSASFASPAGIDIDDEGNLYVADMYNSRIRKVTQNGVVSTVAGSTDGYADGTGPAAKFDHPAGIEIGPGGELYVADSWNHRIRKVSLTGAVTTIAGNGEVYEGNSAESILIYPMDLSIDATGLVFVADSRGKIRVAGQSGTVSDLAGMNEFGYEDGDGAIAKFGFIMGLTVSEDGVIYLCDSWNHAIRKITFE